MYVNYIRASISIECLPHLYLTLHGHAYGIRIRRVIIIALNDVYVHVIVIKIIIAMHNYNIIA